MVQQYLDAGDLKGAAVCIKSALRDGLPLEGLDINLANILLLAGDWQEIDSLLVRGTNTLSASGWLNSIRLGRPVNAEGLPIPWYTYPAIDFLDQIVKPDWSVFEWGSGNSTLWWSSKVKSVVSVEDDQKWYHDVAGRVPANTKVLYRCGREYCDCILEYPDRRFDVVVVDGSHRNEAAINAALKVKHGGILIFGNADNPEFNRSQSMMSAEGFYRLDFWGLIPSYLYKNCTSIYLRNPELLRTSRLPFSHCSSVGMSCQQALNNLVSASTPAAHKDNVGLQKQSKNPAESYWLKEFEKQENCERHQSWFRTDTIDYWRHERMYEAVFKCLSHTKQRKWLTIGDGRYGLDAIRMQRNGFEDVTATDIDAALLDASFSVGTLKSISEEDAENLSFGDNSFDYVLCKESYHHFSRPMLALYEMLRVASKAVVLVEPQDPYADAPLVPGPTVAVYETDGNYIYTLSRRELEKVAYGLGLPALAYKNFCDIYLEGVDTALASEDNPAFTHFRLGVEEIEARCARGEDKYNMLMAVVFVEKPDADCIKSFVECGWEIKSLK